MIRNKKRGVYNDIIRRIRIIIIKDERFVSEGKLLKNKIVESALKLDKDLIKLLWIARK